METLNSIQKIIDYIYKNLDSLNNNKDHLDKLYEKAYRSKSAIDKKFKLITGRTIQQYIIDLKMEKAKKILHQERDIKVVEVLDRINYHADAQAFRREFKKKFGYTPKGIPIRYGDHYENDKYLDDFQYFFANNRSTLDNLLLRLCLLCFPDCVKHEPSATSYEFIFDVGSTVLQFDWMCGVEKIYFSIFYHINTKQLGTSMFGQLRGKTEQAISPNNEEPYLSLFENVTHRFKEKYPTLNVNKAIGNWDKTVKSSYEMDYFWDYYGVYSEKRVMVMVNENSEFIKASDPLIQILKDDFESTLNNYLKAQHKVDLDLLRSICENYHKSDRLLQGQLLKYYAPMSEVTDPQKHIDLVLHLADCPNLDFDLTDFPDLVDKPLLDQLAKLKNPELLARYTLAVIQKIKRLYDEDELEFEFYNLAWNVYYALFD